jgi:HK97 family phage portal protein
MAEKPGARLNLLQRSLSALGLKSYAPRVVGEGGLTDSRFVAKLVSMLSGRETYTGRAIDDVSAMQISTVFACVRLLSQTMGTLPLGVYTRDDSGNAKKVDHELADVLVDTPNEDMTSQEYVEALTTNLSLRGNGYALVDRSASGRVTRLYPMVSADVQPMRDKLSRVVYKVAGEKDPLPADRVWHVKGFGSNGLVGLSPIGAAAQAMGLALTMEEFSARFFGNGARMSGVVKAKEWLTEEQRPVAKALIDEMYSGASNAHKTMLLEGGMDYTQLSVTPEEAQFLLTRGFSVKEICRFFGVPPHMVADLEKSAFTNIEQQSQDFVTTGMLPLARRFEQSGARRLLSLAERKRLFLRFNFEGLLRADSAARAALYGVFLDKGVSTRNEVRALENWPRSDAKGMDDFTVQAQMVPIEKLGQAPATATPATPATGVTQ